MCQPVIANNKQASLQPPPNLIPAFCPQENTPNTVFNASSSTDDTVRAIPKIDLLYPTSGSSFYVYIQTLTAIRQPPTPITSLCPHEFIREYGACPPRKVRVPSSTPSKILKSSPTIAQQSHPRNVRQQFIGFCNYVLLMT